MVRQEFNQAYCQKSRALDPGPRVPACPGPGPRMAPGPGPRAIPFPGPGSRPRAPSPPKLTAAHLGKLSGTTRERLKSVREMQPLPAFEGNNIETEETWARRLVQQVGEQKVALDSCARPRCAPTNWVAGLLFGTEAQVLAPMIGPGG